MMTDMFLPDHVVFQVSMTDTQSASIPSPLGPEREAPGDKMSSCLGIPCFSVKDGGDIVSRVPAFLPVPPLDFGYLRKRTSALRFPTVTPDGGFMRIMRIMRIITISVIFLSYPYSP